MINNKSAKEVGNDKPNETRIFRATQVVTDEYDDPADLVDAVCAANSGMTLSAYRASLASSLPVVIDGYEDLDPNNFDDIR
jgi:hypothetical protein